MNINLIIRVYCLNNSLSISSNVKFTIYSIYIYMGMPSEFLFQEEKDSGEAEAKADSRSTKEPVPAWEQAFYAL